MMMVNLDFVKIKVIQKIVKKFPKMMKGFGLLSIASIVRKANQIKTQNIISVTINFKWFRFKCCIKAVVTGLIWVSQVA